MQESKSQRARALTGALTGLGQIGKRIDDGEVRAGSRGTPGSKPPVLLGMFLGVFLGIGSCGVCEKRAPTPQNDSGRTVYSDTVFQQLNESDGLATPATSAFAEDGDGFLWVGTQSGMSRWDGYHFRNYQAVLGVAGALPDNLVQVLYADAHGRLWIGTNGGLALYDRKKDEFTAFPSKPGELSRSGLWALASDNAQGLWVGSPAGLAHFDIGRGRYSDSHSAEDAAGQAVGSLVRALARDADGTLWVGSGKGLFRSNPQETEFSPVPLPQRDGLPPAVWSLCRDSDGDLWIGTEHGALVMDRAGAVRAVEERGVAVVSGERVVLQEDTVSRITEAGPGVVWLGTPLHGIVAVSTKTLATHRLAHDVGRPSSLAEDSIQALYRDRGGIVWVGTRHGISRTDPTRTGVMTFYGGTGDQSRLADKDVLSVLPEPTGLVWLGLAKGGVDIFDLSGRRVGSVRPDPSRPLTALPKDPVQGLVGGPNGTVYIGSKHGVYRADGDGRHLTRVRCTGKVQPDVTTMVYDRGVMWVGGRKGLWKLEAPGTKSELLSQVDLRGTLTDSRITSMSEGPSGTDLWVATENGLNRIDQKTMAVERILPDPNNPTALGTGFLSSVLLDREHRLWVSTFGGGINLLEGRDSMGRPRFRRVIGELANANVDVLLEGPDGKIWASTDGGIAILDPSTFQIHMLQQPDGVAIADYWINSGGVLPRVGMLFFGGLGGLTVIQPDRLNRWDYIPPVVVTRARVGSREIPTSQFNDQHGQTLTIGSEENSLMLEFSALDYSAPKRNRYEYRLDGFDRRWTLTDPTERLASYTNLPPGNYRLELRGSNRAGAWAAIRTVKIRVLPAWYQTIWSRVLFSLAGLLLLAGGFQVGTAYLRARQRALKRQVALRTAELEELTAELKLSQQKLEQLAYSDSLTNLPNRRMFNDCFRRLLALKQRQHGIFALLVIDLDSFKQINDTYGHDAGDAVLVEVAQRLGEVVRESDCFARVGGDEFFMLLSEPSEIAAVEYVCCKMIAGFAEPVRFRGLELEVSVSVGGALYPRSGESQDNLFKSADLALYRVKRNGGNGWHLQESEHDMSNQPQALQVEE